MVSRAPPAKEQSPWIVTVSPDLAVSVPATVSAPLTVAAWPPRPSDAPPATVSSAQTRSKARIGMTGAVPGTRILSVATGVREGVQLPGAAGLEVPAAPVQVMSSPGATVTEDQLTQLSSVVFAATMAAPAEASESETSALLTRTDAVASTSRVHRTPLVCELRTTGAPVPLSIRSMPPAAIAKLPPAAKEISLPSARQSSVPKAVSPVTRETPFPVKLTTPSAADVNLALFVTLQSPLTESV